MKFLEHRIAERRIIRLIQKWLRAGVSEDGRWSPTKVGTPQGAVASPRLANVFLHYVFDLWVHQWRQRNARGETFDFLGFTHSCGVKFRSRAFLVKRKSSKKRLRARLRAVKERLAKIRHRPIGAQGVWLGRVVLGYFWYFAIPGNIPSLAAFRDQVIRLWHRSLLRRSQRSRLGWDRFGPLVNRFLPHPKVLHDYPNVRFDAKHPK